MAMLSFCVLKLLEGLLWLVLVAGDLLLSLVYYPILWLRRYRYRRRVGELQEATSPSNSSGQEKGETARIVGMKTVVIVGGNFAGQSALHELADNPDFRVILIDQKDYFEYTPGVLRLFCEPTLFDSMAAPLPRGTHDVVLGRVTSVADNHVLVSSSPGSEEMVEFDYLILATGADYRQPITPAVSDSTFATRSATWRKEALKVTHADSVLILGGGAVGVELAAEIACYHPRKSVTLVQGNKHLVPLFPQQTIDHTEAWFRARGVELLLDTKLERWDTRSCTTKDGRVLEADLVFVCFGLKCNSQSVQSGDLAGCLSQRKEVQVNEFLQLESHPHIFAAGDVMINPSREIKQAYYAEMNGKLAAKNIIRLASKEQLLRFPDDMAGAPIMPLVYVVSLGRYDASLGFNQIVVNGLLASLMKWIIEWTKVCQLEGRPIGHLVWVVGDAITFLLSRTCFPPPAKSSD
eukprot:TRINITY_DN9137_c0_g1_i2.p1 TRINITY_DN9137_c0_g1~~TRINITY_DN9137_c0_g1_i2.p1  ORF type:complete len:483 (-),score=86.73 TRINITY_DN9137_c0_g1_i2:388-1779(-)